MSATDRSERRARELVVLVVGASQGIGAACAQLLSRSGHRVYGASRSVRPGPTGEYYGLPMDVTDDESVRQTIATVMEREGRIDVLINAAGFAVAGPVADITAEEAQAQFDTNLFGTVRTIRAVVPHFRDRRSGLIINVGSLATAVPLPYQAYYCASKTALGSVCDVLRMEVRRDGVQVVVVEPGDIKTSFTSNRRFAACISADYKSSFDRVLAVIERDEQNAPPADCVARLVARIVAIRRPRARYRVGLLSQRAAALIGVVLPKKLFCWLLARYYGV